VSTEKPLFIPLIRKWYEAFASGKKTFEMRAYGKQWSEKYCYEGRAVTLSLGYGKAHRLHGFVKDFRCVPWDQCSLVHRMILRECMGPEIIGKDIAYIYIDLKTAQPVG
jgi:hypothetical protein